MPSTREASNIQEERIKDKLGGQRSSNSGAYHWRKGDIHIDDIGLLIECKTCMTPKDSFSIKKEWIEKNTKECFESRLANGVIAFNFNYQDKKDYYIIDDNLMKYLVECLKKDRL